MRNITEYTILGFLFFLIPISLSFGFTVSTHFIYPVIGFLLLHNLIVHRHDLIQVLIALFIGVIAERIYVYNLYRGPFVIEVVVMFVLAKYIFNQVENKSILRASISAKLYISAFVFLAFLSALIAIVSGVDPAGEFISFQRYVLWSLLFLLYGLQIRQHVNYKQADVERIFAILTICVSCLHMFALFTETNLGLVRAGGETYKFGAYFRYGGVFGNTNVQGVFLVAGMMFGAFLYDRSRKLLDKAIGSAAFVCGAVSILISGSRMGLALVPFMTVLFLFYNRNRLGKLFSFIVGSVIAMIVLASTQASKIITFFNRSQRRIENVRGENTTREGPWSCSSDVIASNPLGVGIDNDLFMQKIAHCLGGPLPNPHNLFLDFGVHLGWLGLVLFFVGFVFLTRRMWKFMFGARRMMRDDASTYFALTAVLCYGVTEAFAFDLHKMHLVLFFIIGLALGGGSLLRRKVSRALNPQENKAVHSND